MQVLMFVAGLVGAYALVSLIRAVVRGLAWLLGYAWGLADGILPGHLGRALVAFGGLVVLSACIQQF